MLVVSFKGRVSSLPYQHVRVLRARGQAAAVAVSSHIKLQILLVVSGLIHKSELWSSAMAAKGGCSMSLTPEAGNSSKDKELGRGMSHREPSQTLRLLLPTRRAGRQQGLV